MRGLGWGIILAGSLVSACVGALLGSKCFTEDSAAYTPPAGEPAVGSTAEPRLQGAPGIGHTVPSRPDQTAPTPEDREWIRRELQSAGSRLALMQQLSRLASRAAPAITGPVRSPDAYDFWSAQAVMDLLAHRRMRDLVQEHKVARSVLEEFVVDLLASGVRVDPIDPDLAADILPFYLRARRNPEETGSVEALWTEIEARIEDPAQRDALRLHLTASVRPARTSIAENAEDLAGELEREADYLDLEARIGQVESGLERLEELQDRTRSTVARLLEEVGPERAVQISVSGLSDVVRGLLVASVEPDRILRADLTSSFQAYDAMERERQKAVLDYDRLWQGRHLEAISQIQRSPAARSGEQNLVRVLTEALRLTKEQERTLSQYYAARPSP